LKSHEIIPTVESSGVSVKVLSGECLGQQSPIHSLTRMHYFDMTFQPHSTFSHPTPEDWSGLIYVINGKIQVGAAAAAEEEENQQQQGESQQEKHVKGKHKKEEKQKKNNKWLKVNQAGVLTKGRNVRLEAGEGQARVILMVGEKTNVQVLQHGPFIVSRYKQKREKRKM